MDCFSKMTVYSKTLIQLASFASQRVLAEDIEDGEAALIPSLSRSSTLTASIADGGYVLDGDDGKNEQYFSLSQGILQSEREQGHCYCILCPC